MDRFASFADTPATAARRHFEILPNDDTDLPEMPKAVYCEEGGTIVVRDGLGVDLPYTMTAGQLLLIRPTRVLASGTTGTFYGWV